MKPRPIAGILFCLAGLAWALAGNIPVGALNVCVGLMLIATRRRTKSTD